MEQRKLQPKRVTIDCIYSPSTCGQHYEFCRNYETFKKRFRMLPKTNIYMQVLMPELSPKEIIRMIHLTVKFTTSI